MQAAVAHWRNCTGGKNRVHHHRDFRLQKQGHFSAPIPAPGLRSNTLIPDTVSVIRSKCVFNKSDADASDGVTYLSTYSMGAYNLLLACFLSSLPGMYIILCKWCVLVSFTFITPALVRSEHCTFCNHFMQVMGRIKTANMPVETRLRHNCRLFIT